MIEGDVRMRRLLVLTLILGLLLSGSALANGSNGDLLAEDQIDVAVRIDQFAEIIVENPRGPYLELINGLHILNLSDFLENPDYRILWDVTIRSNAAYLFTAEENLSSRFTNNEFDIGPIDTWWRGTGQVSEDFVIAPQVDFFEFLESEENDSITITDEPGDEFGTRGSGQEGRYAQFSDTARQRMFILKFSAPINAQRFDELPPGLYPGVIKLTLHSATAQ